MEDAVLDQFEWSWGQDGKLNVYKAVCETASESYPKQCVAESIDDELNNPVRDVENKIDPIDHYEWSWGQDGKLAVYKVDKEAIDANTLKCDKIEEFTNNVDIQENVGHSETDTHIENEVKNEVCYKYNLEEPPTETNDITAHFMCMERTKDTKENRVQNEKIIDVNEEKISSDEVELSKEVNCHPSIHNTTVDIPNINRCNDVTSSPGNINMEVENNEYVFECEIVHEAMKSNKEIHTSKLIFVIHI